MHLAFPLNHFVAVELHVSESPPKHRYFNECGRTYENECSHRQNVKFTNSANAGSVLLSVPSRGALTRSRERTWRTFYAGGGDNRQTMYIGRTSKMRIRRSRHGRSRAISSMCFGLIRKFTGYSWSDTHTLSHPAPNTLLRGEG